jgi:hypothetical protein
MVHVPRWYSWDGLRGSGACTMAMAQGRRFIAIRMLEIAELATVICRPEKKLLSLLLSRRTYGKVPLLWFFSRPPAALSRRWEGWFSDN